MLYIRVTSTFSERNTQTPDPAHTVQVCIQYTTPTFMTAVRLVMDDPPAAGWDLLADYSVKYTAMHLSDKTRDYKLERTGNILTIISVEKANGAISRTDITMSEESLRTLRAACDRVVYSINRCNQLAMCFNVEDLY